MPFWNRDFAFNKVLKEFKDSKRNSRIERFYTTKTKELIDICILHKTHYEAKKGRKKGRKEERKEGRKECSIRIDK